MSLYLLQNSFSTYVGFVSFLSTSSRASVSSSWHISSVLHSRKLIRGGRYCWPKEVNPETPASALDQKRVVMCHWRPREKEVTNWSETTNDEETIRAQPWCWLLLFAPSSLLRFLSWSSLLFTLWTTGNLFESKLLLADLVTHY